MAQDTLLRHAVVGQDNLLETGRCSFTGVQSCQKASKESCTVLCYQQTIHSLDFGNIVRIIALQVCCAAHGKHT